jgi:hypothetical protein
MQDRPTERVIRCEQKVRELDHLLHEVSVWERSFAVHEDNIIALRKLMGEAYTRILDCKKELGIL